MAARQWRSAHRVIGGAVMASWRRRQLALAHRHRWRPHHRKYRRSARGGGSAMSASASRRVRSAALNVGAWRPRRSAYRSAQRRRGSRSSGGGARGGSAAARGSACARHRRRPLSLGGVISAQPQRIGGGAALSALAAAAALGGVGWRIAHRRLAAAQWRRLSSLAKINVLLAHRWRGSLSAGKIAAA